MGDATCLLDDCSADTKHGGRGWCSKHYQRWKKHGDPRGLGARQCRRCDVTFQPTKATMIFCSQKCCMRRVYVTRKRQFPARPCERCSTTFQPATAMSRFCTRKCAIRTAAEARAPEWYESQVDRSAGPDACHPWTGKTNRWGYGLFWCDGETLSHRWAFKRYVGPLLRGEEVRHTCDNPPCQNRLHWLKGSHSDNIQDCVDRGRTRCSVGERNPRAKLTAVQVAEIRAASAPAATLAARYGVTKSTIQLVRSRKTWAHLP